MSTGAEAQNVTNNSTTGTNTTQPSGNITVPAGQQNQNNTSYLPTNNATTPGQNGTQPTNQTTVPPLANATGNDTIQYNTTNQNSYTAGGNNTQTQTQLPATCGGAPKYTHPSTIGFTVREGIMSASDVWCLSSESFALALSMH